MSAETNTKATRAFRFVGGPSRKRRPNALFVNTARKAARIQSDQASLGACPETPRPPTPRSLPRRESWNEGYIEPPTLDGETLDPSSTEPDTELPTMNASFLWPPEPLVDNGALWGHGGPFGRRIFDPSNHSSIFTDLLTDLDGFPYSDSQLNGNCFDGEEPRNLHSRSGTQDESNEPIAAIQPIPTTLSQLPETSSDDCPAPQPLTAAVDELLLQYDQEFCVLPLTSDFKENPFRCIGATWKESRLLFHSILALSYRHLNRVTGDYDREAREHKSKAVNMLQLRQGDVDRWCREAGLLDAVLILFTLECSISAHGTWTSQLHAAHRILVGIERRGMLEDRRIRAQIAMLVWWDVTLALTSRKGRILPDGHPYDVRNTCTNDGKTLYNVSGCPEDLFQYMIQIGSYAREFELAMTMTCVVFDDARILAIEHAIRNWHVPDYAEVSDEYIERSKGHRNSEEIMNYRQDLHHCAEAWRCALLLYIERVFKWDRKGRPSPRLGLLARKILDHVTCCRRSTMLQKQLLLPVFLAGCETTNADLRQGAQSYCMWWREKTRYDMFLTAVALFEEVWSRSKTTDWWGSVMDEKSQPDGNQYLLG